MRSDRSLRRDGRESLDRPRLARLAFIGLAIVAMLVYYAGPLARPFAAVLVGMASVGAIGAGVRMFRPQRWMGWVLISVAVALLSAGGAVSAAMASVTSVPPTHPGPPDVFYL